MISAVTINYDGFEDTRRCVQSLQKAYSFDQIVVVDNPAAESDTRLKKLEKPGVHIIYNDQNVGFGAANNIGIEWILNNTASNHVLLINNDAIVGQYSIANLLREEEENTGILTSRILFEHDRKTIWYAGAEVDWKRGVPNVKHAKQNSDSVKDHNHYVPFASGCVMLIKRAVFDRVGGFDERYFLYEEDVDFCLRTLRAGYKIKYIASSIIYHKVNASVGNKSKVNIFHPQNPNLLFFIKHRVQNRIINVVAHGNSLQKMKFLFFFGGVTLKKNIHFVLSRNFKAVAAWFSAVRSGIQKGRDKKKERGEAYQFKVFS